MMIERYQTSESVSEQNIATLDAFAQKKLQTTQFSEVMMPEPALIQRGAIYLMSIALGFSVCLLYWGKVSTWINARGMVVLAGKSTPAYMTEKNLVTQNSPLMIKAVIPNKDIGFIRIGMEAQVKVDAYPFQEFGTVPARVQQILPNDGNAEHFIITLELLRNTIKTHQQEIPLFQGLMVETEMKTREQRLFELLLSQH